jgi:hypothetical protein
LAGLNLDSNRLGDGGLELLARMSERLPALRQLSLAGNDLTSSGLVTLAQSPLLQQLHSLDIRTNRGVGDAGVAALAASAHAVGLTRLTLNAVRLSDAGLEAVSRSRRFRALEHLDVGDNFEIGWTGVRCLAGSAFYKRLRSLSIGSSRMGAAGVAALIGTRPALHSLRLGVVRPEHEAGGDAQRRRQRSLLEEEIVQALAGARLPRLRKLQFIATPSMAAAQALAASPSLKKLWTLELSKGMDKAVRKFLIEHFGKNVYREVWS